MKCTDLHKPFMFANLHPHGAGVGMEGVKLPKNICLGIEWNVQICTGMLSFQNPHPNEGWDGMKDQVPKKTFFKELHKDQDLHRKVMFNNLHPHKGVELR